MKVKKKNPQNHPNKQEKKKWSTELAQATSFTACGRHLNFVQVQNGQCCQILRAWLSQDKRWENKWRLLPESQARIWSLKGKLPGPDKQAWICAEKEERPGYSAAGLTTQTGKDILRIEKRNIYYTHHRHVFMAWLFCCWFYYWFLLLFWCVCVWGGVVCLRYLLDNICVGLELKREVSCRQTRFIRYSGESLPIKCYRAVIELKALSHF